MKIIVQVENTDDESEDYGIISDRILDYSEEVYNELQFEMTGEKPYCMEYEDIKGFRFCDLEVISFQKVD